MSLQGDKPPMKKFNSDYMFKSVKSVPFLKAVKTDSNWSVRSVLLSLLPILSWLPQYNCKADFIADMLAGFTVAVMHVPQGMAYAALGNVNPIVGVYMAVFPTLPYVFMGTSKHISLGSFSVTCIMAARPVMDYSGQGNFTDPQLNIRDYQVSPLEVASALCVSVGILQVILGIFKAGYLSVFLSKPIVQGFVTGAAVLVFISQLPHVLGVKVTQHFGRFSAVFDVYELAVRLSEANTVALATSLAVIFCLLICSECIEPRLKCKFKLPAELIIVACGAWVSLILDFKRRYDIRVVGHIPTGVPDFKVPQMRLLTLPHFLLDSASIALVCYAISLSMATTLAMKDNYKIDSNQELFAYGFGNIFGGFFPCLPMAASLSRSAIQYSTGGKTQLVTIFSSIFLLFTMLFVGKCLDTLPYCVLAGIVIKNLKSMLLQVRELPEFWRQSSTDGVLWVVVFASVIFLDITSGLVIAFLLGIISIVMMNQKTYICLLGRVPDSDLFLEMRRYQAAVPVPGMIIVQIYAGLHFANIDVCINRIEYLVKNKSKTEDVKVVVLVFSAVLFTDPEALGSLTMFIKRLNNTGIEVCIAGCTGRVYEQMARCKFFNKFSEAFLFPSIQNTVAYHEERNKKNLILENPSTIITD